MATWLHLRMWHTPFWKQDVPLAIVAALFSLLSLFLTFTGGIVVLTLAIAPFLSSPIRPSQIEIGSWHMEATSGWDLWWVELIALVALAVLIGVLWGMGWMRVRLASALSGQDEEDLARRNVELAQQLGRVSAGRASLIDAFDAERARIERDLHDGAQQDIVAATMSVGMARLHAGSLPESGALQALLADLDRAQECTEAALRSLRDTVHGIRPVILTERGLIPALHDLAGRAPLPTTLEIQGEEIADRLTSPVATTFYFAISEALTNAAKHGGHGVSAQVRCTLEKGGISAVVSDTGCGFTPASDEEGMTGAAASGLVGMRERLESMGGSVHIDSSPGRGTTLTMRAPYTPPWAASTTSPGGMHG